jgi:psp operon transcriptional activator
MGYQMGKPSNHNRSETAISTAVDAEALGQSEAFLNFSEQLSRVAPVNRPVLLIGERGTGKELAAARLHFLSGRWQGPFVTLNCAALAPSLIEAELFGYEKGAFTGAEQRRAGRFESADGGTLFLDEIGNIPLEVQAKILRVVEYGSFERVGGTRPVEVDVRTIGATNADLPAMAADGRFKADLLDRLAFEVLIVPPLRERAGDIDLLADHFAMRMASELNRPDVPRFSRTARKQLQEYPWPGNIRELKNVVERAVYRSDQALVSHIEVTPFPSSKHLSAEEGTPQRKTPSLPPLEAAEGPVLLKEAVSALELRMLKQALAEEKFNQRRAACKLGLSYDQLRGLMRKYADSLQG